MDDHTIVSAISASAPRGSAVRSGFVACLLCLLSVAAAPGGTVHGVVKGNGAPVAGATVRLLDLDRADRTNARGEFTFTGVPAGSHRLFVRSIGFTTATKSIDVGEATAEVEFELRESAVEVEEVVVSASPYARTAEEQYQSAESKSGTDLHASAGASYADKLSDLPGVAVRGNGSAPNRPVLRGLSDNRILVLENGLRNGDLATYDPAHATPIEALSIAQIDVVRGPASILYGPSTIGGLVNIITTTIPVASAAPFSGTVSLEGNTVSDQYAGFFNGVYSAGGSAIGVSAGGTHSQDIHIPEGRYSDGIQDFRLDRLPQSFSHADEASVGYSFTGTFGMIGVGAKYYEMNYGIPGTPPNDNWETLGDPASTSRIAQIRKSVEAKGLFAVDGDFVKQIRVAANFVDYNHSEFPTAQDSSGVYEVLATHFHKQQFNGTLQFQHQECGSFQGVFGLWTNIEEMTLKGDEPLGPNSTTSGIAAYLFEEYLMNEATRFEAGLRFDYNRIQTNPDPASPVPAFQTLDESRNSTALTASLGMVHRLSSEFTFSANLARSFRAPTVQELFANGLDAPSGTYTIGNAALHPEVGYGVDLSLKGDLGDVTFEVTPYLNFINEYVYGFLNGEESLGFPVRQFATTDARLAGVEASVAARLVKNVAMKASVDYVEAQDTKLDVPLPFTPPARGLLRLRYQDGTFSGDVEWRLAAKQTRLGDGDTPTEGYGVVNLGAGIRFAGQRLVHNFSVHCDNLLNQVYRDHLSVIKDFVPQPARGFRLNYDLIF